MCIRIRLSKFSAITAYLGETPVRGFIFRGGYMYDGAKKFMVADVMKTRAHARNSRMRAGRWIYLC